MSPSKNEYKYDIHIHWMIRDILTMTDTSDIIKKIKCIFLIH